MSDFLLELGQNKAARNLIQSLGLPVPMPQSLRRANGPRTERPLMDEEVAVGGGPDAQALAPLAAVLTEAGASPFVTSDEHKLIFAEPGEAHGRPPKTINLEDLHADRKFRALVFDATGIQTTAELKGMYEFFHALIKRIRPCGRILVIARPPDAMEGVEASAAQGAMEGFTRSLAKEVGKKGSTAQLLWVEEGAEDRLDEPVRFLLSARAAFMSGQPLRVSAVAGAPEEIPSVRPLEGKVALVTGAARGIGAATARLMAAEGAHVVCLDRPADDALVSQVAREIGGTPLLVDVYTDDAADLIAKELQERHGGVDIVIHNAGVTRDKTIARMKPELWDMTIGINLTALVRITEKLVEGPLRDNGRIVALSSIAGIAGNMGQTNYAASKSGVISWVGHLAEDLAERGITVNAVAPGFIETRLTAAIPVVIREAGRRLSNLGQGGQPQDVGEVLTFLSTPGAVGITGNVVRVCGGALIGA